MNLTNLTINGTSVASQFTNPRESIMLQITDVCVKFDGWRIKMPYLLIIYFLLQFFLENLHRLKINENYEPYIRSGIRIGKFVIFMVAVSLIFYDLGVL